MEQQPIRDIATIASTRVEVEQCGRDMVRVTLHIANLVREPDVLVFTAGEWARLTSMQPREPMHVTDGTACWCEPQVEVVPSAP